MRKKNGGNGSQGSKGSRSRRLLQWETLIIFQSGTVKADEHFWPVVKRHLIIDDDSTERGHLGAEQWDSVVVMRILSIESREKRKSKRMHTQICQTQDRLN